MKGGLPRFRFPAGSECSIYNLPVLNLLRPGEPLWITEGCSDCWAMLSAGHKAIAIPSSATLLKPSDVEVLSTLNSTLSTEYHMYPDRDEPGERLFLQLRQVLPNLEHHQLPPDCKDYSEFYAATRRGSPPCLPEQLRTTSVVPSSCRDGLYCPSASSNVPCGRGLNPVPTNRGVLRRL